MKPLIEFCASNLASGSYEALEVLEADFNLDIMEYDCLSYCDICSAHHFALVNGEAVTAESNEELVKKIYKYLEENPLF